MTHYRFELQREHDGRMVITHDCEDLGLGTATSHPFFLHNGGPGGMTPRLVNWMQGLRDRSDPPAEVILGLLFPGDPFVEAAIMALAEYMMSTEAGLYP